MTSGLIVAVGVIVGAVVGSSISYIICKYHQDKKLKISFGFDSVDISYRF